MNAKDLMMTCLAAVLTMLLTLTVFWPRGLEAVDQSNERATVTVPTLMVGGSSVTVHPLKEAYLPGDKPELEILASNPTDKAVAVEVKTRIMETSPLAAMSRAPMLPRELYSAPSRFELAPGQTASTTVTVNVPLARPLTFVELSAEKVQPIRAATLLTGPAPATNPAK